VSGARYDDEALGSGQRRKNSSGMMRWRFVVGVAMEQQDSRANSRRGIGRADRIDLEVSLLLGECERAIDHAAREEARRPFCKADDDDEDRQPSARH
jgi:hypothetical protein